MKTLIAVIVLALVYGWVGAMDYEDAKEQEDVYCENVKAGHWSAYNDSIDCEEK